jgi:putative chitinase
MRLTELTDPQIEEGWRDWAAKAALAVGLAMSPASAAAAAHSSAPAKTTAAATPISPTQSESLLMKAAREAGIRGIELAAFMSQCAHETLDFQRLKEFGGTLDFRKYDPKYNHRKAQILGNTHKGDGALFAGRGFIQITGRDIYRRAGAALGWPLEAKPELATNPSIAANIAVWFWQHRVAPNVKDFSNVAEVTRHINPGLAGLADRKKKFQEYRAKLAPSTPPAKSAGVKPTNSDIMRGVKKVFMLNKQPDGTYR